MPPSDPLFDDAEDTPEAPITGRWFPIRISPDLATGELINVGVCFTDQKRRRHVRLVDSARAFECLYGPAGLENFSFLLTVLQDHLGGQGPIACPSPHVSFGQKRFASGFSPDQIVDRLFAAQVSIARRDADEAAPDAAVRTVDNSSLRRLVFQAARKKSKRLFERMFRERMVTLTDANGNEHALDLPIYADDDDLHRDGPRYATFVSAVFRSYIHRGYYMDSGSRTIWNTRSILHDRGQGGLYIRRPAEGASGYDAATPAAIDNDIDNVVWPFRKMKNMKIEISPDPVTLAECGLALAE